MKPYKANDLTPEYGAVAELMMLHPKWGYRRIYRVMRVASYDVSASYVMMTMRQIRKSK